MLVTMAGGLSFKFPNRRKIKTNGLWSAAEKLWHINVKETMAVWLGLSTFAKKLNNWSIRCRVDNTMAVAYVNHQGGMRNSDCDKICRDIWEFCQESSLWLIAVHIPGVDNGEGDHESRVTENTEWELPDEVLTIFCTNSGLLRLIFLPPEFLTNCLDMLAGYPTLMLKILMLSPLDGKLLNSMLSLLSA